MVAVCVAIRAVPWADLLAPSLPQNITYIAPTLPSAVVRTCYVSVIVLCIESVVCVCGLVLVLVCRGVGILGCVLYSVYDSVCGIVLLCVSIAVVT